MAQLITWDLCYSSFSNEFFNANYEGIWILIASAICFLLFYGFRTFHERISHPLFTDARKEKIADALLQIGVFLLCGFLIYFFFIFKPGMVEFVITGLSDAPTPTDFMMSGGI